MSIDLNTVTRIEADVKTSGTNPQGQWFSFWLDPTHYVQPPKVSAEIDLVENLAPGGWNPMVLRVRTNFAGCDYGPNCQEKDWAGVPGNAVNHHITAKYDKASTRLEVYHCPYGSATCPPMADAPFIQINKFKIGEPKYYLVADIWQSKPGEDFEFSVDNIQLLSDSQVVEAQNTSFVTVV